MKAKCLRCGYEWQTKKRNPVQCAKCHSVLWDKPRQTEAKPKC